MKKNRFKQNKSYNIIENFEYDKTKSLKIAKKFNKYKF